ncbi:MAG: hypothetical protein FWF10_01625 [Clostridiales bacterium]|nr:hypothetical protein [Clostridiales bacterium]
MKKAIALILITALMLTAFAACSRGGKTESMLSAGLLHTVVLNLDGTVLA